MRYYTVTVSAEQVREFNSTWPCSPIPVEPIKFHFQGYDLVDIESETPSETFDGDALLALSYDAQKGYGKLEYDRPVQSSNQGQDPRVVPDRQS